MRRSTRRKLDKIGLATIAVGVVVMGAFGLKTLMDSGSDPAAGTPDGQAFIPYETDLEPETTITPSTPATTPIPLTGTVGDEDPLAGVRRFGIAGDDNTPHKVTITLQSDGSMYFGFRFYKGDEGYRYASRKISITNTVRGSRTLVQVGVKYQQNATYAKCTISVDGVPIVSRSTKGTKYQVTVCVA
ncbi:hypothetical protein GCM10022234_03420 [Aeromicrobium panaciterrae]|uniref:hypothetical protein n=1 Tax=Aeromicrobium panaciterrae TaxID=363861 RepID=UPI0031E308F5